MTRHSMTTSIVLFLEIANQASASHCPRPGAWSPLPFATGCPVKLLARKTRRKFSQASIRCCRITPRPCIITPGMAGVDRDAAEQLFRMANRRREWDWLAILVVSSGELVGSGWHLRHAADLLCWRNTDYRVHTPFFTQMVHTECIFLGMHGRCMANHGW